MRRALFVLGLLAVLLLAVLPTYAAPVRTESYSLVNDGGDGPGGGNDVYLKTETFTTPGKTRSCDTTFQDVDSSGTLTSGDWVFSSTCHGVKSGTMYR